MIVKVSHPHYTYTKNRRYCECREANGCHDGQCNGMEALPCYDLGMIHLHFERSTSCVKAALGPAPWFGVAESFVKQGPYGLIVGTFREHIWEVYARRYPRFFRTEPHTVRFEGAAGDAGIRLGPFARSWSEDGLVHRDLRMRAHFDPARQLWHELQPNKFWPVMILSLRML
jgi:hypothetical protein